MAADFIGAKVLVILRAPPNAPPGAPPMQVKGTVADIVGQQLTLHDGKMTLIARNSH